MQIACRFRGPPRVGAVVAFCTSRRDTPPVQRPSLVTRIDVSDCSRSSSRNERWRRFAIGAEPLTEGGVHFRVWAPAAARVYVQLHGRRPKHYELSPEDGGYFSGVVPDAAPGMNYSYRLDDDPTDWPDPASRYQPHGPEGTSQIVDPTTFTWHDQHWPGVEQRGQVLYEMHVGTFTQEGTWRAAAEQLLSLAEVGITAIELMPVADFPGTYGWSYDTANLFAPCRLYGTPDDFRYFVDTAHTHGIAVLLDVVYNHLGTIGERLLKAFAPNYFSTKHTTEWGAAVNFDDDAAEVRLFILENVRYWIQEFHLDGYRIDATQALFDDSPRHIMLDICRVARAAAPDRKVLILAENEPQRSRLMRSGSEGGFEFDGVWNDDFHHSALVRLTGQREAYYTDYRGTPEEFIASFKWGYLYQGQRYSWQRQPRGTPAIDIDAWRFVNYLENHDQLANTATGQRVHQRTSPGLYRTLTALLCLAPQTPLLFQGQEYGATTPFLYFNDCRPEDRECVRRGRAGFLSQFPSLATPTMQAQLTDPCQRSTFERSRLDHRERERHAAMFALHRDLLRLRREDPVLSRQNAREIEASTISAESFFFRYLPPDGSTRLFVINLGHTLTLASIAHPLVAPPEGTRWGILWSSEDPAYGGSGTPDLDTPEGWRIPGQSAVLLHPVPLKNARTK
jgi:maltooligosyltrehalose trehalohydrolase